MYHQDVGVAAIRVRIPLLGRPEGSHEPVGKDSGDEHNCKTDEQPGHQDPGADHLLILSLSHHNKRICTQERLKLRFGSCLLKWSIAQCACADLVRSQLHLLHPSRRSY